MKSITKDSIADILEKWDDTDSVGEASIREMRDMFERLANEIRKSNELHERSLAAVNGEVDLLKAELSETRSELVEANRKLDYLENQSRRNNLRFDGIDEDRNETWEQTELKVRSTLMTKLSLSQQEAESIKIERAHRTGRARTNANGSSGRSVIAKFSSFKDRSRILKRARERKPVGFYVNEDFSKKVHDKRRSLVPEMIRQRQAGKTAYLSFDTLVVRESTHRAAAAGGGASPPIDVRE